MALPDLESFDAKLNETCSALLGDTIKYTPAGGSEGDLKVFANHRDGEVAFESVQVIEQDMSIQVLASLVPEKPGSEVRIQLPKIGDQLFKPVNVRRDDSGDHWEFELKAVDA